MADLVGQRLGQYEITAVLGIGGMATVYRATQTSMKRSVAVKVIKPDLAEMADFQVRFEREAQMVASLSHPYILKVFDYGQQGDMFYLVMELLQGGSLADLIKRGPLPLNTAKQILREVASALDYAHKLGIIHRDLKPQNVLLDTEGNAHLTDFGIAKVMTETSGLTRTGMAMGTPAYMPPEQWQGAPLDARADVYSLGVMLFEMLTGTLPFTADTPASMMYKHLQASPPPIRNLRTELPSGVDAVLAKGLAKEPEQRYSSAGALADAFDAAISGTAAPVSAPAAAGALADAFTVREVMPTNQTATGTRSGSRAGTSGGTAPIPTAVAKPERGGLQSALLSFIAVAVVLIVIVIGALLFLRPSSTTPTPTAVAGNVSPTVPLVAVNTSPTTTGSLPTNTGVLTVIPPTTAPVVVPTNTTQPSATTVAASPTIPTAAVVTATAPPTVPPTIAPTDTVPPPSATVPTGTPTTIPTITANPGTKAAGTLAAFATMTVNAQASFSPTPTVNEQETVNAIVQSTQVALGLTQYAQTIIPTNPPTATGTQAAPAGTTRVDDKGITQMWVPPGCYTMGSAADQDISNQIRGQTPRQVCMQPGYWIDKYETSNADFQKFIDAGGYTTQQYWTEPGWQWVQQNQRTGPTNYPGLTGPNQPRVGVTLYEAQAYANWREGQVPTEAEWEYAARGPDSPEYPWGNTFDPARANILGTTNNTTVDVTMYDNGKSWVGALNMAGNAGEWVADCYADFYDKANVKDEPISPCDGSTEMVKGSSYRFNQFPAKSTYRFINPPVQAWQDVGVRVISYSSLAGRT